MLPLIQYMEYVMGRIRIKEEKSIIIHDYLLIKMTWLFLHLRKYGEVIGLK